MNKFSKIVLRILLSSILIFKVHLYLVEKIILFSIINISQKYSNLISYVNIANAQNLNIAKSNYLELEKLYIRWKDGLLGSRKYYKGLLTEFLIGIIGSEILTNNDYIIISPEGVFEKKLVSKLNDGRWLEIVGDIDNKNLREIIKSDQELLKKWWRSKKLISVYGKIKKFKLNYLRKKYIVTLYLDNIRLIDNDNIRKNSKK